VPSQILGSSSGGGQFHTDIFSTDPIPLTMKSTTLLSIRRASEIFDESFAFPWTIVKWRATTSAETSFDSRMSVSLDGVRTTASSQDTECFSQI
jgi:hypothetical protein